jgi:hypothetical protein
LVGGVFVIVHQELGFGNVVGFFYWDIEIEVFDVKC